MTAAYTQMRWGIRKCGVWDGSGFIGAQWPEISGALIFGIVRVSAFSTFSTFVGTRSAAIFLNSTFGQLAPLVACVRRRLS